MSHVPDVITMATYLSKDVASIARKKLGLGKDNRIVLVPTYEYGIEVSVVSWRARYRKCICLGGTLQSSANIYPRLVHSIEHAGIHSFSPDSEPCCVLVDSVVAQDDCVTLLSHIRKATHMLFIVSLMDRMDDKCRALAEYANVMVMCPAHISPACTMCSNMKTTFDWLSPHPIILTFKESTFLRNMSDSIHFVNSSVTSPSGEPMDITTLFEPMKINAAMCLERSTDCLNYIRHRIKELETYANTINIKARHVGIYFRAYIGYCGFLGLRVVIKNHKDFFKALLRSMHFDILEVASSQHILALEPFPSERYVDFSGFTMEPGIVNTLCKNYTHVYLDSRLCQPNLMRKVNDIVHSASHIYIIGELSSEGLRILMQNKWGVKFTKLRAGGVVASAHECRRGWAIRDRTLYLDTPSAKDDQFTLWLLKQNIDHITEIQILSKSPPNVDILDNSKARVGVIAIGQNLVTAIGKKNNIALISKDTPILDVEFLLPALLVRVQ